MTNFDVKQYKAHTLHNLGERILLFNIFRLVWPNIQKDFRVMAPSPNSSFENLPDREVKYRQAVFRFRANLEHIDNVDFVFMTPDLHGTLFHVERVSKKKHSKKKMLPLSKIENL